MGEYTALAVSVITLLSGVLWGAWLKVLVGRTFSAIDNSIKELQTTTRSLTERIDMLEKSDIRIVESLKVLDDVKCFPENLRKLEKEILASLDGYHRKADYIREMDQVAVQVEATCQKIDGLSEKFEKFRDTFYSKRE